MTRTNKAPRRRKQAAWQQLFRPRLEQFESLTLPSTVTWIGGSGDWDTAANWSTGLVPGGSDDVVINSGSSTHGLTTTDAVHSVTNSAPVTIAAGTLTVGSGTSQINAALTVSSGATLTLNNSTVNGSGTLTNSGTLNITSSTLAAGVVNQGTLMNFSSDTFNGSLANTAAATLWVQGNSTGGSASLTSANGFTNDGILRLESISSTWSETLTISSGVLTNASDGTLLVNAGSGGSRTLTGNLTNQGTVTVAAGVTFSESSTPTFTQAGGTFTVDPTSLFYVNGGSINFSGGALSGPVFGDSSAVNVTAGVTTPSTLYMNYGTLVNNLSPVVTLWDQGNSTFGNSNVTLTANATNAGTLHLESANNTYTSELSTNSFTLTNTGTISVSLGSGGSRIFNGNLTNAGQVSVDSNAFLSIQSGTYTAAGGTINGPAVLNTDTIVETASPATPSTLVLVNYATLASDNLANYTLWVQGDSIGGGITLISASSFTNHGTLRLESTNNTYYSDVSVGSGNTLTNAADGTLLVNLGSGGGRTLTGNLTNQGTVTVGAGATFPISGTLTNDSAGTLTGGTYNISGTFQFSGAAITTNAATIVLTGASSQIIDQSSNNALANFATNAAAGSFTIQNGRNFTSVAAFSNAGSLTVGSSSTFTATGNYTQSAGSTTLAGGTLTAGSSVAINSGALSGVGTINGSVTSAGQVNPGGVGAAGLLTINGNYTQTASGALNIELGGTIAGSQFDQLAVTGTATLAGTLNLSEINSFPPAIPNSFQIVTAGSVSGTFAAVNGLTASDGVRFLAQYDPADVTLLTRAITATAVQSSVATSTYGQTVTFTATVTTTAPGAGTPTGTITFTLDGTPQTPVALNGSGQATLTLATLTAGSHSVSAAYSPTSYFLTSNSSTLSQGVNPAPLTITADNKSKFYGAALPAFTASYTGFVLGEGPSVLTGTQSFSTAATASSPVGAYAITPSGQTDANYAITYVAGTLTIAPVGLVITANNQTMPYGGPLPALTASYSGFVNGDTAASLTTPPTVSTTATAASHVAGSPYSITASGAVDANYTITYVPGNLTVTPVGLTISADNQTKVYGAALPALTVSYSGFVNGDTAASLTTAPTVTTTATAASHVAGTPYPITASGAVDSDYTISYVAGTLTITPAALTITADNQTKVYGAALPTLTVSYSGFVNGDTAASLTTAPTVTTTATAASHVAGNPYPITASGAVDSDYTISYGAGALTITPAALTITANNQSMIYGGPLPALTVSYSGFVNGDTATSLIIPPTVTTTATASSHVAGSPYPITASSAVDSDYTISYGAGALTITPAALTITANNQTKVYGASLPTLTVSYSGFVNGDTAASLTTAPTVTTTATAASHVGLYAITAAGAVDSDYSISYTAGNLTVTPAALTITANDQTTVYGGTLPTFVASYNGFVNGDTAASLTTPPTLATTATASSHVGSYAITATGATDPDYTINYVYGTLTITPAALTITANNQTMVYGGTLPTLTASYSGFVNGDTVASLTTAPTLATTATASSHVGSYAITASGAADPDYTISYANGTLTITPAALTITANNQTMVYGAAVPTLTASYSGFVNGDTAASLTTPPTLATTATSTSPVGTYPITASGAVDPDYAISYVAGTLTITQAASAATVSSSLNPSTVGQSVTFTATVTAVAPGSGTPTGTVTFMDGTNSLGMGTLSGGMATFTTSTLTAGTHSITVVYGGDGNFTGRTSAALSQAVNSSSGVPVVTGVSPNSGSTAGGTVVTITSSGFTGATVVKFGDETASFTFVSDAQITATAPVDEAEIVNIQVVTPRGTSVITTADQFTYLAPAVSGVSPNSGSTAGGTIITITGSNFVGVTGVHIDGVMATSFTVVSATQITATAPIHTPGTFNVRVTNAGATSAATTADQFTYLAPAVTGVSPNVGPTLGGTVVTITGSDFIGITAVHFGGTAATSFTVVSATQITATAPAHALGTVSITVTNAGATSATSTADHFTYEGPIVSGVSPNSGSTAGGTVVTITGSNFLAVTAVDFGGKAATSYTVVSATQITAIAPDHGAGIVNIHVTSASITSATSTADQFIYLAPTVSGVSPNSGSTAGGTVVTITGSNFIGITEVRFGGTPAVSFTVVSATQITATAPVHAVGNVDLRVVNAGAPSAIVTADQFTYQASALLGVSPNSGLTTGGTVVTILGSNFIGVTEVRFGGSAAANFTVVSPTQITVTAPAHGAGTVDVRVVNAGATSAVITGDQFTYFVPAVSGVSPNSGTTAGGTVVTIMGRHFTGVSKVEFGATLATSFTVVSDTQITATAPAHAAGTVDLRVVNGGVTSAATTADKFTYIPAAGPAGSGGRLASTLADLASSLAAVDGASVSGRSRTDVPVAQSQFVFRVAPKKMEVMTPTLRRADVENFFSAAPMSSTLGWSDWVTDLVPTDGRPAADVLSALV